MALEQDAAGLRIAAGELLEESLLAQRRAKDEKFLRDAANADSALADYEFKRTLDDAYYRRAFYLFNLAAVVGDAPPLSLRTGQIHGVAAVRAARAEFERRHPECPQCSAPLEQPGAFTCWRCNHRMKEFPK